MMPASFPLEYENRLGDFENEVKEKGGELEEGARNGMISEEERDEPTQAKRGLEWGTRPYCEYCPSG